MLYFGLTNALFMLRFALSSEQRLRQQSYFLVLIGLFLFSSFRYMVGCDWPGYYNQYLIAENIDWSYVIDSREPIWWTLLWWIRDMGLPYPVVNIVSSAVFFIGVHILARRQPDPLGFMVLLFPILIINMPMSTIRQGAAIGLVCIAFAAFIDRRQIWFAFWVVIAAGWHTSALIFLLLLPVATGKYTKSRLAMLAILAIPGTLLLASGETAEIASSRYIGTGKEAFGAVFRLGLLGLSALYFFLFVREKWMRTFPHDYSLVSIGAIGMGLSLLILPISSVIGDRLGYYFIPVQAIIFSRISYLPFRLNHSLHSALPYVGLLLFFFAWAQYSELFQQCFIPYKSWLFGFPGGNSSGI